MVLNVSSSWTFITPSRLVQSGRVSVLSAPSGSPITLSEAKGHLRVTNSGEDTFIQRAIDAVTQELQFPFGWLGRSLLSQQLELSLDTPPPFVVYLGGPPVTSIDVIKYRDTDDIEQTIPVADYTSNLKDTGRPAMVWPSKSAERWPSDIIDEPDSFRIEYTAGYANASAVPANIINYMLARIGDMYRDRETTTLNAMPTELPHLASLVENYRVR